MSSIQRHNGKQWRARWRDPDGKQTSKVFARKIDAEQFLVSIDHKILAGEYIDPAAGKITVREWCEDWRERQIHHRASTASQIESYFRKHVYDQLGSRQLRSITPDDVQRWITDRSTVLAASTVELLYNHFAGAMKGAVAARKIGRTPCEGINLPEVSHREVVPPTLEQVELLAGAIKDRYRLAVVLGAGAGLRLGEVFGLQVDRLDMMRRSIRVNQQLVTPSTGPAHLGPTKSKRNPRRDVPIADVVVHELNAHMQQFEPVDGFVFTSETGSPVRRSTFQTAWKRAKDRLTADEDVEVDVAGVRFHDLRHHYASALIASGCSVKVVQSHLGHASAAETLDIYSHLWPDDDDRSRDAIQALWVPRERATSAL